MEIIYFLFVFLLIACLSGILLGFILTLSKNENVKKIGLQILQYSAIGLLIGFSICYVI